MAGTLCPASLPGLHLWPQPSGSGALQRLYEQERRAAQPLAWQGEGMWEAFPIPKFLPLLRKYPSVSMPLHQPSVWAAPPRGAVYPWRAHWVSEQPQMFDLGQKLCSVNTPILYYCFFPLPDLLISEKKKCGSISFSSM